MVRRWSTTQMVALAALTALIAGCSLNSLAPQPAQASQAVTAPPTVAAANCQSGNGTDHLPIRGTGAVQMAGLIFATDGNHPRSGSSTKFVWRVTGNGDATFTAIGPDGAKLLPDWQESHGISNLDQPGEEWGMGFTFPTAGCWTIYTSRSNEAAQAGVLVIAS